MTSTVTEGLFLVLVCCLYWTCRDRRRLLKRRIGGQAFRNAFQVGRNLSFMLNRRELKVRGDTSALSRGCILYSFHFGVWESMPRTLRKLGYRVGIIVNRYSGANPSVLAKISDRVLRRWRTTTGATVFYADEVLQIVRFLRSGGVFGMLVDGNTLYQKYGKAMKLAAICGVPLIPFAAYRGDGDGVLQIGCDLPAIVSARPLDYLWAYRSR